VRPNYIKVLAIGSLGNIVVSSLGNLGSVLGGYTDDRSLVDWIGTFQGAPLEMRSLSLCLRPTGGIGTGVGRLGHTGESLKSDTLGCC
jgi:hypothetical protein